MKKRVTDNVKLKLILITGILLRLYYILATPVIQSRQYDLGSTVPEEGIFTGHLGYIFYLFTYKGLPDFDPREVYQFFHPPLHHTLSALWMGVVSVFTDKQNVWIEWLQVLPFVYSVLMLFIIFQICKEFGLQGKALLVVMTIVTFHPSLIFMAGSINNDCLSLLFQFATLWLALRWYRERHYKNILGIALTISFGMLTKLSVGMIAIPVAFLFLYVLITEWQGKVKEAQNKGASDAGEKKVKERTNVWCHLPWKRIAQYAVFGVVCVPIGLAWAVRCLVLFDMPLTYVNRLPEQSWQYVGNYSLVERFVPNVPGIINNLLRGSLGYGENVWVQLFRTSALGECDLSTFPLWGKLVALLMIALAFLVAVWAFVLMIRVFIAGKKEDYPVLDMGKRVFWLIGYAVLFISYLNFAYNFPHQCSMNFRYMVPTVLFPALAAGLAMQRAQCSIAVGKNASAQNDAEVLQDESVHSNTGASKKWCILLQWLVDAYAVTAVLTIVVWSVTV